MAEPNRQTAARLGENAHPLVVTELLRHSRTRTTMVICGHVLPALACVAADRLAALMLTGEGR